MLATMPAPEIRHGWQRTELSPGRAGAGQPIVHVIGFEKTMNERIAHLLVSVGLAVQAHADIGSMMRVEIPNVPGCAIIQAPLAQGGAIEFLRGLPHLRAGLPVIVVANRADVRTAVSAMKAGAVDFIDNPSHDRDLLEAVAAAISLDRARRQTETDRTELLAKFAALTPRERQVMALVTQGRLNKQVAGDLGLSEITVKVHRGSVMRKMGARTLADLVRMADAVAERSEFRANYQCEPPPARIAVHAVLRSE
jgi:FixJ family two-component response regulator